MSDIPVVLVFAGHDPSGGAGIQADIIALSSMGCHAATVVTAITVQDTGNVHSFQAVDSQLVIAQAQAILHDSQVAAIKIGMIGSDETASAIALLLNQYPDIPVILDPVLKAGGGSSLGNEDLINTIQSQLLPRVTLLTPNSLEARTLATNADNLDACAEALQDAGCAYVLITGSHEDTNDVINTLYGNHRVLSRQSWPRLPNEYHGSGCTLASAAAGLLAQGLDVEQSVLHAQEYTWSALDHGYCSGQGQLIPDRLFWLENEDEA
ncbi:MAG: hydroxymethylpyrimidine/phosphomethylpyrimidine kinase [Gammaproteobacteria bacterium]|nr:hydroxymethylpyrimidine/phosphomethylpyrimidine kinase [Gammaproteobacteria bacterium]